MKTDNEYSGSVLSPEEEVRLRNLATGFIEGIVSEKDILRLLHEFRKTRQASAEFHGEASLPEPMTVSADDARSPAEPEAVPLPTAAAGNSVFQGKDSAGQKENSICETVLTEASVSEDIHGKGKESLSGKNWSTSELITGKLLTGVGAAVFLAIGFVLAARNIHWSFGPAGKFIGMLLFSLAAIVWGLFFGRKRESLSRDLSSSDVFRVTVAGTGFTLLYVTMSLGCFYFDLLPPWVWMPFLLCWCLTMLWASVYRHHVFSLLAQLGIMVSLPIAESSFAGSTELHVLMAFAAQIPFHAYGFFRKQPVVCYNSAVSFLILFIAVVSGEFFGTVPFPAGDLLPGIGVLLSGAVIGFLAICGATGRLGETENKGYILFCSVLNTFAFAGLTVLVTVMTHGLLHGMTAAEAAVITAIYAADYFLIERSRNVSTSVCPVYGETARGFMAEMLPVWIVAVIAIMPELVILAPVLAVFHAVYDCFSRKGGSYFQAFLYFAVFSVHCICRDGLIFPDSVTPAVWKAVFTILVFGVSVYALKLQSGTEKCEIAIDKAEPFRTEGDAYTCRETPGADGNNGDVMSVSREYAEKDGLRTGLILMVAALLLSFVYGNFRMLAGMAGDSGILFLFSPAILVVSGILVIAETYRLLTASGGTLQSLVDRFFFGSDGAESLSVNVGRLTAMLLSGFVTCVCISSGPDGIPAPVSSSDVLLNTGIIIGLSLMLSCPASGFFRGKGGWKPYAAVSLPGIVCIASAVIGFSAGFLFRPVSSWPFFCVLFLALVYDLVLPRMSNGALRFAKGIFCLNTVAAVLFYFNYADYSSVLSELDGSAVAAWSVWGLYTVILGYFCFAEVVRSGIRNAGGLSLAAVSLTVFLCLTSYGLLRTGAVPVMILYPLALAFYAVWYRTRVPFLRTLALVLFTMAVFFMYGFHYQDLSPEVQKFFNTVHFILIGQGIQSLFSKKRAGMRLLMHLGMLCIPVLSAHVLGRGWAEFPMYWWMVLAAVALFGIIKRDSASIPAGIVLVYFFGYGDLSPVLTDIFNTGVIVYLILRILFAGKSHVAHHAAYTLGVAVVSSVAVRIAEHAGGAGAYPVTWSAVIALCMLLACWNMRWNAVLAGARNLWEESWGILDGSVSVRRGIYPLAAIILAYFNYYGVMTADMQAWFNTLSLISCSLLLLLWFRENTIILRSATFMLLLAFWVFHVTDGFQVLNFIAGVMNGELKSSYEVGNFPVIWWAVLPAYAVMAAVLKRPLYMLAAILLVYLVYYTGFTENVRIFFNFASYATVCMLAQFTHKGKKEAYMPYFLSIMTVTVVLAGFNSFSHTPWAMLLPVIFGTAAGLVRNDWTMSASAMLSAVFMTLALSFGLQGYAVYAVIITIPVMICISSACFRNGEITDGWIYFPAFLVPYAIGFTMAAALSLPSVTAGSRVVSSLMTHDGSGNLPYCVLLLIYGGFLLFKWRRTSVSADDVTHLSGSRISGSVGTMSESFFVNTDSDNVGRHVMPLFGRLCLTMILTGTFGGVLAGLGALAGKPWDIMLFMTGCGVGLLVLTLLRFEEFSDDYAQRSRLSPDTHGFVIPDAHTAGFILRKFFYVISFTGIVCTTCIILCEDSVHRLSGFLCATLFYFLTVPMMFRSGSLRLFKTYYCILKFFVFIYVAEAVFGIHHGVVLTVSWLLGATVLLFAGFRFNNVAMRRSGLVACMLCVMKLLLVDISYRGDLTKALAFMAAGIILLGACFVYNYFSRTMDDDGKN